MNPLVKKEIRLLLPGWMVAMLLALVQAFTRPYDFYIVCLMFIGLTIMALTSIGREASLNTFSFMLAQPAERMRIWQTKLSVLAIAFFTVLVSWLVCFFIAGSYGFATNHHDDYSLFITICLIATATFTGGLWTTLLLRQVAGAFWLTLLVPAVLSGFSAGFLSQSESNSAIIAGLCVVFAIYSVGGFLFARWLFFRAQDAGWSGGVIPLPEWNFFTARAGSTVSTRSRKPIFALLKKEFQLQQASLIGAVGLLVMHVGVIALRWHHQFNKDSVSDLLLCIFWILWLVMPVVIGNMAIAEERKLGVMEGQLCQPASRRIQFAIKGFVVLFLGILLGGVMPILLEVIGGLLGAPNPAVTADGHTMGSPFFPLGLVIYSAVMALVSFFASSLAKNFLQAVGYAVATFIVLTMIIAALMDKQIRYYSGGLFPGQSILPLLIATPAITLTLLWLAYLNFKKFRDGWPLWRRNLLGFAGAFVFIIVTSIALYNRVWEVFEPAEPAHGPARLSISQPAILKMNDWETLTILLPDGLVLFDFFGNHSWSSRWEYLWRNAINPLPKSTGLQKIIAGSNWVSATAGRPNCVYTWSDQLTPVHGYMDTVGIQRDGSLWVSDNSNPKVWAGDKLSRFGNETNWQKIARSWSTPSVLLLKKDGTLWRWGNTWFNGDKQPQRWPGLRTSQLYQIGTGSDWKDISAAVGVLAQKSDGTTWTIRMKGGKDELSRATNFDRVPLPTFSRGGDAWGAYVRPDGTLWLCGELHGHGQGLPEFETRQSGRDTNWVTAIVQWNWMVALKSDGTLWQWNWQPRTVVDNFTALPTRLGIHDDWVALANAEGGVLSLAADGSLWFWPDREYYKYYTPLLKLPKQPQLLGNVFGKAD